MKDYTMVIPTYWGMASEDMGAQEEIVFDHPTPLNETGTLPNLLDSLDILDGAEGKVVIIAVANNNDIAALVRDKIETLVEPFRSKHDITCMHTLMLEKLAADLKAEGVSQEAVDILNLNNYSAVRNMCSIAGILNASKYTIFIDDDEVFHDTDFLGKIERTMGTKVNGESVRALAGYYLQPDTPMLDESKVSAWRKPYWNNAEGMNRAFEKFILHGDMIKPTPFAFGGNMTITLDLLKQVPFDPRITRGEDIDFLINLKISGVTFFLHRELAIKHLPPESSSRPDWKKVREDILRYLYERKKVADHPEVSLDYLQPYPGMFVGPDIHERVIKTNKLLKAEYEAAGDIEAAKECDANIELARNDPFRDVDTRNWLKELTEKWQELTRRVEGRFANYV
ncbi:MAG: hypothetical protein Q7J27_11900 [Syntrophales bacterium]|nr:hypothetical protein [Syntrophales bacterium]